MQDLQGMATAERTAPKHYTQSCLSQPAICRHDSNPPIKEHDCQDEPWPMPSHISGWSSKGTCLTRTISSTQNITCTQTLMLSTGTAWYHLQSVHRVRNADRHALYCVAVAWGIIGQNTALFSQAAAYLGLLDETSFEAALV